MYSVLDADLAEILNLAREKSLREGEDNGVILCAIIQVQSSRDGYCSLPECGDCPLGDSGCVSSERLMRATDFFASGYLSEAA